MAYLDIIKELEEELSGDGTPLSGVSGSGSEARMRSEKCELSEKSPTKAQSGAAVYDPPKSTPDPPERLPGSVHTPPDELPLLGRKNNRGEMILTIQDIPELQKRLELAGWKVTRKGNELICKSPRGVRIQ